MSQATILDYGHDVPTNALGRCRAATPPGAKLTLIEMIAAGRARITYRYHGLRTPIRLEVSL